MTSTLVNKTCGLCCGSSLPEEQGPTRGIKVTHVQTKSVTLALWDLAGQHDYQVLHEVLYSACMPDLNFADGQATFFALVCNAKNIDIAKSQLNYWMRFISSNSLKDTTVDRQRRVFVVLNCFDGYRIPEVEVPRWKALLKNCADPTFFGRFLNLSTELFITNVTSRTEVQSFQSTILKEATAMLRSRKMPQICHSVQEDGKRWMKRQTNSDYPVLTWHEFRDNLVGGGHLEEEKWSGIFFSPRTWHVKRRIS